MLTDLRQTLRRCRATMLEDAAGAAVLMIALVAALHLPSPL